ncbi:hypothetical protein TL16_g12698 [Triparma laevis f. inornata]|uniref:Uncharacterized protein n=2 Tax=Triparma laevis TaxID=1534972 RepID=A0A9W7AN21_9STRA|nr:hypothetical protein TrLO_g4374 [Triparma laevis f. longispina]GMH93692.1 hypothetical protein TL16_g12698 [Triparma laevis f. inornata]
MKTSRKSSTSSKKLSSASSVTSTNSNDEKLNRTTTRSQLLETRKIMRSGSDEFKGPVTLDVAPVADVPIPSMSEGTGLNRSLSDPGGVGGNPVGGGGHTGHTEGGGELNSAPHNPMQPLNSTTLDVAKSAERLMMSGYAYDISETYPVGHPLEQFQLQNVSNAINQMSEVVDGKPTIGPDVGVGNPGVSVRTEVNNVMNMTSGMVPGSASGGGDVSSSTSRGFAGPTEALHLTLMLRRTLSELDSKNKHLNDSNREKLQLHSEVEKVKLRLERLQLESEDLQRRTLTAEENARRIIEEEKEGVNAAVSRASAAEKRFEILVDWSRNEESKRLEMEQWRAAALQKMEEMERSSTENINVLNHEVRDLGEALDESNSIGKRLRKELTNKETQLIEITKKLAVAEELSRSSSSESAALKSLSSKLEIELEGTRSRLKTIERERAQESRAINEEVKMLTKDCRRHVNALEESESRFQSMVVRSRQEKEGFENVISGLRGEKDRCVRENRGLEGRLENVVKEEKGLEGRLDGLIRENEELKRQLWSVEKERREREEDVKKGGRRIRELEGKNEELNRIIDGLEEEGGGKRRSVGTGGVGSPSLLRYDVKPLY